MKTFRHLLLLLLLIGSVVCVILLLNFTAPNPTGRRYSSAMPPTTGQGSAGLLGAEGELILARDLGLLNNNTPGQKRCVCNSLLYSQAPPTECQLCFASSPEISNYRIPDFVGDGFFAESKNAASIHSDSRDYQQIQDFVAAAVISRQPVWVFVRVNTRFDPTLEMAVQSTGGAVVYYFNVPGWVDPVDEAARSGLIAAVPLLILLLVWEVRAVRIPAERVKPPQPSAPVQATKPPRRRRDALEIAIKSTEELERFKQRIKDKARRDLEEDDIWADPS